MKKYVFSFLIAVFLVSLFTNQSEAQIINGAYKRTDPYQKKPLVIPMVREADVYWSQMIWRIIDVREKINQPLFYPTKPIDGLKSLTQLLLDGIDKGTITAYDARNDDDFKLPISMAEVKTAFGADTTIREVTNFDTGEKEMRQMVGEIRPEDVKQFMVKEEWYFDKQNSRLQVRIVGICPIQEFFREGDDSSRAVQRRKVFWVYYPEARNMLAQNLVINLSNDARRMSYDDLFIKRYFNSYIVQESNVFNNRAINQYLSGKNAMLESKRIEDKIFNFEQDLWEY